MTTDDQRAAFEAWAKATHKVEMLRRSEETGAYLSITNQAAWLAWQASI